MHKHTSVSTAVFTYIVEESMRSLVCLFILAFLNVSLVFGGFFFFFDFFRGRAWGRAGTGFLYLCQKIFKFSNGFFNTIAPSLV